MTLLYWFAFLLGLVTGIVLVVVFRLMTTKKGWLRIDHSNPKKDILRIEVDGIVDRNIRKFILKVDHDANLSQD